MAITSRKVLRHMGQIGGYLAILLGGWAALVWGQQSSLEATVFGEDPGTIATPRGSFIGCELDVNPTSVTFDGGNPSPATISVSNIGNDDCLEIDISLSDPSNYSQSNNCPVDLSPSPGICLVTVEYIGPSSGDADGGVLEIASFGSLEGIIPVSLAANPGIPIIVDSPVFLGSVPLGSLSPLVNVLVTNQSAVPFSLPDPPTLGGSHPEDFAVSLAGSASPCAASNPLPPGQSCHLGALCTPTALGNRTATVTIGGAVGSLSCVGVEETTALITVVASNTPIFESGGNRAEFVVNLDPPTPDGGLVVDYRVSGSATPNEDYLALSGSILLAPGQSQARLTVSPLDDQETEDTETVIMDLVPPSGYELGSRARATVEILDDEPTTPPTPGELELPVVSLLEGDPEASEPDDDALLSLGIIPSPTTPISVTYQVGGSATPSSDYTALSGSLTVQPGQAIVSLPIETLDDTLIEDTETIVITLESGTGYRLGEPTRTTINLQDDDKPLPVVTVVASDPTASEGGDPGVFRFTLDQGLDSALDIAFELSGSATAGEDYDPLPTILTFLPGQTNQELTVVAIDDDLPEKAETVSLQLVVAENRYAVGTPDQATVTIGIDREEAIDSLVDFAETPNQREVAEAVAELCVDKAGNERFQADCEPLIDAALEGNPETGEVLAAITPDMFSSAADISLTGIQAQLSNVRSRLLLLRRGAAGMDVDGLVVQNDEVSVSGEQIRTLFNDGQGGAAGDDDGIVNLGRLGVFVSGTVSLGDRDGTDNQTGLDFQTSGITLGADYRLQPGLVLGGAVTYLNSDSDFDNNRGNLDLEGWGINAYGVYYLNDNTYLDGTLGYSWFDYDQQRNLNYSLAGSQVDQRFDAGYDGNHLSLDVGAGYEYARGAMVLEPVVRLSYVDLEIDGFRERARNQGAGSGWAAAVDNQDVESLTLSMGLRASYVMSLSWGILQPQLDIDWLHEFKDDTRLLTGRFVEAANTGSNRFELSADDPDSNYFRLGMGASLLFPNGATAFLQYNTILGYDNLTDHAISAGLRWEF